MDMDNYIGRLLDNRYEIQEVIGTGGMAVVYRARCHRLNRSVAIKILKDEYCRDEEFRRRFHAESQAVAMLSHPNIVSVYDVSTSSDADYIVMELIDGITLKQYMGKKGVLNWKETLHFAIQIAKALEHAHSRGIVHRDIKPHNVMVLKNGSVKVADFGIARVMSQSNTLTKEALGSVHYISPEQAKGGRVDNRSDIYSLGVVMYEMMACRPPYDGESPVAVAIKHINGGAVMPSTINPNIPGGLEQIIMKAMGHDVSDRYESATAMLYDMDEFRKEPTMLFDYNTPPTDAVTRLQSTPAAPIAFNPTTAEKVAAARTEQPRPRREAPQPPVRPAAPAGRTAAPAGRTSVPAGYSSSANRPSNQGGYPQQQRSATSAGAARAAEARRAAASKRKAEEERRNKITTFAVVGCSVVAIIALAIFLVSFFGNGQTSTPEMVSVPSLVGKDYTTLENITDVQVILQERRYDDTYPAGQIIYQNPSSGSQVAMGTKVYVDVSMGPEPVVKKMPSLVNIDRTQAESYLKGQELNLQILFRDEYNDSIIKGNVTRTDPVEGTPLEEGQTVFVYVSLGPEKVKEEVPDVEGMDLQTAISTLNAAGFKNVIREEEESDRPYNEVLEQSVDPYTEVDVTTKITLTVSDNSIRKESVPNVVGRTVDNATDTLDGKGFTNVRVEYVDSNEEKGIVVNQSVAANTQIEVSEEIVLEVSKGPQETTPPTTVPTPKSKTVDITFGSAELTDYNVKLMLGDELIREWKNQSGENTIEVTLSGIGTYTYDIYINDVKTDTLTVTFG